MKVLSDRYQLTRRIAIGGMGEVWAATDTVLHREVAVKVLRDDLSDSDVFLERFRIEARHTAALSNPGIARVFDYGEDNQDGRRLAYLVMELVPGQPLSKVMAAQGAFPVNTVLSLLAQTAEALYAAHALGVVHRDVKPANLLVLDDGTIKVTDFGIARATNAVSITEVGQVLGTARYMSPEQASGAEATAASDVYALGVIGYEMLAGHPLFTAESAGALAMAHVHQPPPPLPSQIPSPVRHLIMESLSKNPRDRPKDAQVFASKLRRLQLTNMPPPVGASGPDTESTGAPTRMMTAIDDGSKTAIMPIAAVVSPAPSLLGPARDISPRRKRRRVMVLLGAATIATVAVVALIVNGGQLPTSEATTPTVTQISIAGATIDAKVLIGKTLAQASAILTKAGYLVNAKSVTVPGVVSGLVVAVQPSGAVPFGSTITLSVTGPVTSTSASTTTSRSTTTTPVAVVITSKPHGKRKP